MKLFSLLIVTTVALSVTASDGLLGTIQQAINAAEEDIFTLESFREYRDKGVAWNEIPGYVVTLRARISALQNEKTALIQQTMCNFELEM